MLELEVEEAEGLELEIVWIELVVDVDFVEDVDIVIMQEHALEMREGRLLHGDK